MYFLPKYSERCNLNKILVKKINSEIINFIGTHLKIFIIKQRIFTKIIKQLSASNLPWFIENL